jgi:hypothetical protein
MYEDLHLIHVVMLIFRSLLAWLVNESGIFSTKWRRPCPMK